MIASVSDDKTLKVFDVNSGECLHTFKDEKGSGLQVAWHPDSCLIGIALNNGRVKIYDFKMRKLIQYYRMFEDSVNCIDFHPTGHFMVAGVQNGTSKILDLLEGRDIFTIQGHNKGVTAVKFSRDGKYFGTGSIDKHLMLWQCNLETQTEFSASDVSSEKGMQIYEDSPEKEKENQEIVMKKEEDRGVVVDARNSKVYIQFDDVVDV